MAILTFDDTENKRIVNNVLADAYHHKGGVGVAACIAIVNDSMFELVKPDSSTFYGRWQRHPPETIAPGEVVNVVHRKRDGESAGSQGYLEYRLRRNNEDVAIVYFGWDAPWGADHPSVGCSYRAIDTVLSRGSRENVTTMSGKRHIVAYAVGGIKFTLTIEFVNRHKSPKIIFSIVQNHRYRVRNRSAKPVTLRLKGDGNEGEDPKKVVAPGGQLDLSIPRSDVAAPIAFEFPDEPHVWRWTTERGGSLIIEDEVDRQYPNERIYVLKLESNEEEIPLGRFYKSAMADPEAPVTDGSLSAPLHP